MFLFVLPYRPFGDFVLGFWRANQNITSQNMPPLGNPIGAGCRTLYQASRAVGASFSRSSVESRYKWHQEPPKKGFADLFPPKKMFCIFEGGRHKIGILVALY